MPALRGAVLAFGTDEAMTRTAELEEIPDGAWALRGERGLTYADDLPAGNELTEGEWWGPFYDGEPLVSLDEDFAEAAGLEIGDRMTFGVLGVERTVRVANFRRIDWESLGFNYVFVFSPNALRDAPHIIDKKISLDRLNGAVQVFKGSAREGAIAFPANVNVAAALGLAGF